ncbi:MAG: hypothetical protein GSR86_05520 [Desulfurococcales archaeon]|nr:hypothetical protein [Desulfurococcales archaeon]
MPEKTEIEDVKKWLVEGKDEPETFVDLKWVVMEEDTRNGRTFSIRFTHPSVPVNLLVLDMEVLDENAKILRLVVETGIKTIDLDRDDKLRLYRYLLEGSKMPLAKFYLFGDEDEIGIAVDLDKRMLTKEELDLHLAAMLMGYSMLAELESLKNQVLAEQASVLMALVAKWMEKGVPREKVLERLIGAGMDREMAEKLVDTVYGAMHRISRETLYM